MNDYKLKKPIRMIALDLDGTTLNSNSRLSERTRNTLEEACRQGVCIVVSTGRSYNSLPDDVKSVKGVSYAITSNGAHINDIGSGRSVYDDYLSEEAIKAVEDITSDLGEGYAGIEVFIDGQAYMDAGHYHYIEENGCEFRNADYVLWSRKPIDDINKLLHDNSSKIENINICFKSTDALETAREAVESIPNATITSSFRNNLEVGGPDTSKKHALIELMLRLGIEPDELMCCGDAPNDIQMLEFAGLGVAVGNAWGGTKDHADYITGTNDEDGVAQAIELFVLK